MSRVSRKAGNRCLLFNDTRANSSVTAKDEAHEAEKANKTDDRLALRELVDPSSKYENPKVILTREASPVAEEELGKDSSYRSRDGGKRNSPADD